jgi:anti-sigma regulatory factor (Ser/Thr protein kinase)
LQWFATVLVLEDPGGAPLDQLLGHPLDPAFSLRLAIGLSTAIGQLHQRGLIHKDIKPPNVLVNVATGEVYWSEEHFRIFDLDPKTAKPSYSLFVERIHPEDRPLFEQVLERAVREKGDFEHDYRILLPDASVKFVRSVGQSFVNASGELEFIVTLMDVTELKRAQESQIALARAGTLRATARCRVGQSNALASVPALDEFLGQVMAGITRQLGAVSSTLRLCHVEQKRLTLEFVFQDGRMMSPAEVKYPEALRSIPLEERPLDLLRIAQEAISNAVRHAKPTVVSVGLRWDAPNLVLGVTDNGSGMVNPESAGTEGFGISNMRARAEKLGARLEVRTPAGCGNSIVVHLSMN